VELPFAPSQIFPLDTDRLSSFRGVSATDGAKRGSCENGDARDVSAGALHGCFRTQTERFLEGLLIFVDRSQGKEPFLLCYTTHTLSHPLPLGLACWPCLVLLGVILTIIKKVPHVGEDLRFDPQSGRKAFRVLSKQIQGVSLVVAVGEESYDSLPLSPCWV